jgi:hypothetical protein
MGNSCKVVKLKSFKNWRVVANKPGRPKKSDKKEPWPVSSWVRLIYILGDSTLSKFKSYLPIKLYIMSHSQYDIAVTDT